MSDDDSSEKSHEATEQKLLEARKKGDFVKWENCYGVKWEHKIITILFLNSTQI